MRHFLILFAAVCAGALAADTILSASYAFAQFNSKNYVYVTDPSTPVRLSVTIAVASYVKDSLLHLSFLASEGNTDLPIVPKSSCISEDLKEVFSYSDGSLSATATIATPTTCTLKAEMIPEDASVEFTGMDVAGQAFLLLPFTTTSSSFEGRWAQPLTRVGDTNTLTITSSIPFDAEDVFTIAAGNGTPFITASACRSTDTDMPLFSVSAQGSRMLFAARGALAAPFSCAVEVVMGPTTVTDTAYTFLAPAHGLALPAVSPLLSVLDNNEFHPRIGIVGAKLSVFGSDTFSSSSSPSSLASTLEGAVTITANEAVVETFTAPPAARAGSVSAFRRYPILTAVEANAKAKVKRSIVARGVHARRMQAEHATTASKLRPSLTTRTTPSPLSASGAAAASDTVPAHALYVGVPASALRAGDTVRLYYSRHRGLAMGDCTHMNGTVIGTHRLVFEAFATTNSFVTSYITLTAQPNVNEDGLAELYCHVVVADYSSYSLAVTAVGVRGGVFSAYERDATSLSLRGYNLYNSGAFASLAAYSADLITLQLTVEHPTTSPYVHFDVDFSLQGLGIKDADEFFASCEGYSIHNQGYGLWQPSDVTVADGDVRLRFDASTIAPDTYYTMTCMHAAMMGQRVALYDHLLDAPLMPDTVRDAVFSLAVDAGAQTHVLSRDAVAQVPLLPFTLTIRDLYSQLGQALRYDGLYISALAADIGLVLELPGIALTCSSGKVWIEQELEETYASLALFTRGFDASCSGLASLQGFVGGDGSQNMFSANMMQGNAADLALPAVTRAAYSVFISTPRVVTAQQFSFLCPSLVLGTSVDCTLGHTLLQPASSLALTFDHDLVEEGEMWVGGVLPCTVAGATTITVLKCTVMNKRVLTCVKQSALTTAKCTLPLTFVRDFARNITATASFSSLPADMVFAPTFTFPAASGATFALTTGQMGQDLSISIFVGHPQPTDTLRLRISLSDSGAGALLYTHFEPSTGVSDAAATLEEGDWVISLALLDTAKASAQPLRVSFRHLPDAGLIVSPRTEAEAWYNGVSLGHREATLALDPTLSITYVPQSTSPLVPVVRFSHGGLSVGDEVNWPGLLYPSAYPPVLVCGEYAPITMEDTAFTISTPIPATVSCYMRLHTLTMNESFWSVEGSFSTRARAAGPDEPMLVPAASTSGLMYVQGHSTAYAFVVRDFTTALLTVDAVLTFAFDAAAMDVGQVSCALDGRAVEGVVSAGVVAITFAPGDRPIEEIGPMTCTLTLTPLTVSPAPVFTAVSVLGVEQPDHPLPPFLAAHAPTITLDISGGASVCAAQRTPVSVHISLTQLAFTEGDTLTFSSPLAPAALEFVSCVDADVVSGDIRFQTTQPSLSAPTTMHCQAYVHYLSDAPVTLTATLASGNTTQSFPVAAPPAYDTNFHITRVSAVAGTASYLVSVRDGALVGRMASKDVELRDAAPLGGVLTTDCPSRRKYLSDRWVPFQYVFPEDVRTMPCHINVTLGRAYDPALSSLRPRLQYFDDSLDELVVERLPAMVPAAPVLLARVDSHSVHFTFSGVEASTVTITNAWGMRATAAAPILLYSDDGGAVVGQLVASLEHEEGGEGDGDGVNVDSEAAGAQADEGHAGVLIAAFDASAVSVEDGKYTLRSPCHFNTTGMHGHPLFVAHTLVDFTAGAHSTRVQVASILSRVQSAAADAHLVSGSPYSVSMLFAVTGSDAQLTVDYNNTALAVVDDCSVRVDGSDGAALTPVAISRNGPSFSLAVAQEHTYADKDAVVLALHCTFATFSGAETQMRASRTNVLTITIATTAGVPVLAARVPVAEPSFPPKTALAHTVSFPRSVLFNTTEVSALSQAYTAGLRSAVAGLEDGQVVVSSQRLHRAPSALAVPSPIRNLFGISADDHILAIVTFTVTPTDTAPVTAADISAAATSLEEAFSAAGHSPTSLGIPAETVVDGACVYRCGLGCALCAEGDYCGAHVDCIDAECRSDGKCGTERSTPSDPPDPDNATSAATMAITAVLVVIVAMVLA